MSLETFKRIYDEIGEYLYELHLYNWGEPLLNRSIVEMVEYAREVYTPKIIISSNLSGLSDEWAGKIVRSGADLLNVSIDGTTQESYEKYRVGGNLDQVLNTLKLMAGIKKDSGLQKPLLRWQFIPMKHNEGEIESAREMATELGVDFRVHRVRLNICDFDAKDMQQAMKEHEDWVPQDPKHIRMNKKIGLDNICHFLWDRVVFNYDGSVFPCCKIYTFEDVFENDIGNGFESVWNGHTYMKAREIFTGKRADDNFICQKCVDKGGAL
jgi:MoaA/NifB/PqqE/SkfB family radical SAM enzyme